LALHPTDIGPSAALPTSVTARGRALQRHVGLSGLLWLIPVAIGAIYVIVFVVDLPRNIAQMGWNSSVASAFVMPETLVRTGTGGFTAMGSTGQWVSLWFGLLTAKLPLHRQIWGVAPTLLFVATALIVGWSVAKVASRQAAILAALIGLAASAPALTFLMTPFAHNSAFPCMALLGAYLIWLANGHKRRQWISLSVPPILGVIAGICLASDFLLTAIALIPLTLTAVLAGLRRERRSRLLSLSALSTVAVAIPVAKLTSTTMGSLGYQTLPTPVKIAALSELPARAKLLFLGLKQLFNGYLGTEGPGTLHSELGFASDVVMSAALLALVVLGTRTTARFIFSGLRRASAQGTSQPVRTSMQLPRSVHVIYWFASAATACGAFWLAGEGATATHYSYYGTVVFSVAAVIPLALSCASPTRWLIPAGAAIFFTGSLVGLTSNYLDIASGLVSVGPKITKIARANGVQAGYSNWTDASGLTWGTHYRVTVRPVVECASPQAVTLCAGFQAYIPSWYTPRQRRTFLLVEPNGVDLSSPPAILGKPLAEYTVESMHMYIYSYDIASRFGPV
jgi:hypothetical protein